mgnify:CR=1 FL=1
MEHVQQFAYFNIRTDHAGRITNGLADLTAERARRLVEDGHDVVLLIDSITRLVRAHNLATTGRNAGRTLSGGVSAGALAPSRRLNLAPALLDVVSEVLETQLEHHLDRRLKSLQFLRRMKNPA